MNETWIVRTHPRQTATIRLFCFPSAGYGAAMYRTWGMSLPHNVEVCAVTLPGRESLLRMPPIANLMEMVERSARAIVPLTDLPYAFFGHSMGSWIAFELARWMRRSGLPLPLHLFASSRRPPQTTVDEGILHTLPDSELLLEIQRRYGGIPAAVLREPELLALLLPALRADLTALETHPHRDEPPLACPIASYGGDIDGRVPLDHLERWHDLTSGGFSVRQFRGGHFYLQTDCGKELLREIEERLQPHLRGADLAQN